MRTSSTSSTGEGRLIRGGENIYSVEIEDALYEHPAVAQVAAIGVRTSFGGGGSGHRAATGAKVAADELAHHVADRLAAYNVPTRLWFRTARCRATRPARCSSARCARAARGHRPRARPAESGSAGGCGQLVELGVRELDGRCTGVVLQVLDARVPGIGSSTGDRRSNQARAT